MTTSRRGWTVSAAAVTVCVLAAACGSTAQVANGARQGDGALQQGLGASPQPGGGLPGTSSLGQPGGTGDGSGGQVGPADAVAGSGSGSGAGAGGTAQAPAGGVGTGPGRGTTTKSGANGPGVTATTIALGIPYCNDCAAGNAAVGAGGEDPGDTREYYKAAIADVNDRGGVLGRKLVPVFHEISASDNIDTSAQAACETFTKDHKVFAIFFQGEIVYECARKAGIIAVGAGGTGPIYARYPNLFSAADIRLERLGSVTVKAMVRAGWHKPDTKWPTGKIGLITWENTDYKYAMEKGWLRALHEAGLKETDVRYVAVPQSDKSLADASAAISSAVLAFRNAGIDHVFISDGPAGVFKGTGLTLLFLQNAKSQRYYPRYGFNTNNSPGWENHPQDEEVGMLAVDSFDTERINDEGIALNPQRERCWNLMKKRGLKVGGVQTQSLAVGACDIAWLAEAVLKRSRGTLLPDVIAAAESLGSSYRSPYVYGTKLGRGQHDGAYLFRNARFDEACACMKYTSKPYEP